MWNFTSEKSLNYEKKIIIMHENIDNEVVKKICSREKVFELIEFFIKTNCGKKKIKGINIL